MLDFKPWYIVCLVYPYGSVYICYQCLVTAQIAFSIHMRNGLLQWRNQDTVNARACGHTTFVRTSMQNTEESKGGGWACSPSDSLSSPRSVLRLFWAIPSLKIGCNFHHAFWCGCVCGVTLLLAANSCPVRALYYLQQIHVQ